MNCETVHSKLDPPYFNWRILKQEPAHHLPLRSSSWYFAAVTPRIDRPVYRDHSGVSPPARRGHDDGSEKNLGPAHLHRQQLVLIGDQLELAILASAEGPHQPPLAHATAIAEHLFTLTCFGKI